MTVNLERLSGEELLLLRVLHGPMVARAIDRELDRRALGGPVESARPGRRGRRGAAPAQHAA